MARLLTTGFETRQYASSVVTNGEGQGISVSGTAPTADTTNQFDGSVCAKTAEGKISTFNVDGTAANIVSTLDRTYYFRMPVKWPKTLSGGEEIWLANIAAADNVALLNIGGKVRLTNFLKSEVVFSNVHEPKAGETFLYEIKAKFPTAGKGILGLRVYDKAGKTIYEGEKEVEIGTTKWSQFRVGQLLEESGAYVYLSHLTINDSTGENQNSWGGFEKVKAVKVASDKKRDTNWVDGNSGTTNLFESLNNTPPTGISGSTNGTKIKNATSTTTQVYQANLETYTAAGLVEGDVVKVAMPIFRISNSTTTARSLGLEGVSNPAITEKLANTISGTAVGTDPTGWTTQAGNVVYNPSLTFGTAPVVQVRKNAASTNVVAVDMLMMYVSYEPANSNVVAPGTFEIDIESWYTVGSSVAQSSTQKHNGVYSLKVTPEGTGSFNGAGRETKKVLTPGITYTFKAWVWREEGKNIRFRYEDKTEVDEAEKTFVASETGWALYTWKFTPTQNQKYFVEIRCGETSTSPYYIDDVEVYTGVPQVTGPSVLVEYGSAAELALTAPLRDEGDLLLVESWIEVSGKNPTTPEGWKLLGSSPFGGSLVEIFIYGRIANGSSLDNFKHTWTGATGRFGEMRRITGNDLDIESIVVSAPHTGTGTSPTWKSATSPTDESLGLGYFNSHESAWELTSPPSGWKYDGVKWAPTIQKELKAAEKTEEISGTYSGSEFWVTLMVIIPPPGTLRKNLFYNPRVASATDFAGGGQFEKNDKSEAKNKRVEDTDFETDFCFQTIIDVSNGDTRYLRIDGGDTKANFVVGKTYVLSCWVKQSSSSFGSLEINPGELSGVELIEALEKSNSALTTYQRISTKFKVTEAQAYFFVEISGSPSGTGTIKVGDVVWEEAVTAGTFFPTAAQISAGDAWFVGTTDNSPSYYRSGEFEVVFEFSPSGSSVSAGSETDTAEATEAQAGSSISSFSEIEIFEYIEPTAGASTSGGEITSKDEEILAMTLEGSSSSSGSMVDAGEASEAIAGSSTSTGSETDTETAEETLGGSSSSTGSTDYEDIALDTPAGSSISSGSEADEATATEGQSGSSISSGGEVDEFSTLAAIAGASASSGEMTMLFTEGEPDQPKPTPVKAHRRGLSVAWRLFLVDSTTMELLGEIKQARGRQFQLALNKPGGCNFNVPLNYDLFKDVEEINHGVIAYRNGVPRFSGMIWNIKEQTAGKSIAVQCAGWFETLNHRLLREDIGYPPFSTGSITGGQIVFLPAQGTVGNVNYHPGGLLTIANAQRDTWIVEGSNSDVIKRINSYQKGQSIGQALTQLTEVEAGFDFEIDPLTRVMDIHNWNDYSDKTEDVVFGYNWGPSNIEDLGREFDPSVMVNRVTALGKFGGGFAEDIESQEKFQLFEEMPQLNDVVDPNVLLGYAGGEVLLRNHPRVLYSFQPFPYAGSNKVPQPFDDYDIGDKISFTAIEPPRIEIVGQAVRVFGMNIDVTDEGNEKVSALQISP